jgi:hypothetical protein
VAWTPRGNFAEPDVWRHLLEAYLRAAKKEEGFDGSEFTLGRHLAARTAA